MLFELMDMCVMEYYDITRPQLDYLSGELSDAELEAVCYEALDQEFGLVNKPALAHDTNKRLVAEKLKGFPVE